MIRFQPVQESVQKVSFQAAETAEKTVAEVLEVRASKALEVFVKTFAEFRSVRIWLHASCSEPLVVQLCALQTKIPLLTFC